MSTYFSNFTKIRPHRIDLSRLIIKKQKLASVSLHWKSRRSKTANIKILSANSTHSKSYLLCLEFADKILIFAVLEWRLLQ